jgi:hypothetical protein
MPNTDPEPLEEMLMSLTSDESMAEIRHEELEAVRLLLGNVVFRRFWRTFFEQVEGAPNSADKARFVERRLAEALSSGKTLSLHETYDLSRCPQMAAYQDEDAYWCPNTLETTDDAIDAFLEVFNFRRPNG